MDYEIRDEAGELLASAVTEQVVVNASGELLLTLPAGLRALCASILEFQDSMDESAP
jgi:acyl-CoA thioesterase FadM